MSCVSRLESPIAKLYCNSGDCLGIQIFPERSETCLWIAGDWNLPFDERNFNVGSQPPSLLANQNVSVTDIKFYSSFFTICDDLDRL